jgi:MarR family transcriptional regulator, 2-MHQ and catechol-resistance regulon repressor
MPAANSIPDQMDLDARSLLTALNTLTRFHDRANRRRLRHLRLPLSQAHALEALCTDGALSLSALADRIHLDISTASRMIEASVVQRCGS